MKLKGLLTISILSVAVLMTSCEKEEQPISYLPQEGDAQQATVEMGEDYLDQIFFDFGSNRIVHISQINSWDLAFEASALGKSVFMNGGSGVLIYNTGKQQFSQVKDAPEENSPEWLFDAPSGLSDSTAIGDWANEKGISKGDVFLVWLNPTHIEKNIKKIKLINVTPDEYIMEYADLDSDVPSRVTIPKDADYNYAYFTFDGGGKVLQPDPPKETWDVVFTRYRHIYRALDDFKYTVTGALLNPYKTSAYKDSLNDFEAFDAKKIEYSRLTNSRNVIGFDWKKYVMDPGEYVVDKEKVYVIKVADESYWKLSFLSFYNQNNIKGSPTFVFQRIY